MQSRKPARAAWKLPAALAAITLIAYLNSFTLDLAFDGRRMVRDDPRIRAVSAPNILLILNKDYWYPDRSDRLYRPVTTLSYLLNYSILGSADRGPGYHILNVLLHIANVLLLFALALRLFNRAAPAFFAAALWAVHPIGTEVVANVAGRADLLAALALLGGLLLYLRMDELPANRRRAGLLALFAIALLGMFSKETGVLLVALLLLWDLAFRKVSRLRLPAYAAALAPVPILLLVRNLVLSAGAWIAIPVTDNPLAAAGFWTARFTAIKIIGMDLRLLLWPARLSFDRSYAEIPLSGISDPWAWLSLVVVGALLALAILGYRRDPLLFWAAGFVGITLLPTSNLVILIGSIMAERFLYLPAIGFTIALTALVYRIASPRLASAVLGCAVLLCTLRTIARNPAWQDDISIAAAGAETTPRSYRPHRLLAASLYRRDPVRNLDNAIREEEAAWSILQTLPPDRIDQQSPAALGYYYRIKGDRAGGPSAPEGRAWYEKSVAILQQGSAASRLIQKEFDDAQIAHGKPLLPRSGFESIYINLGKSQAGLGRPAEALAALRYAREINPSERSIYDDLATIHATQGNLDAAAIVLDQKAVLFGLSPATVSSLRNIYGHLPDGACALAEGGASLNPNCPRVHADLCAAWADLAQVFIAAREPARARQFEITLQQNACSAPPVR